MFIVLNLILAAGLFFVLSSSQVLYPQAFFPIILPKDRIKLKNKYIIEYSFNGEKRKLDFHDIKSIKYQEISWFWFYTGTPNTYDLYINKNDSQDELRLINFSKKGFDDILKICEELNVAVEEKIDKETVALFYLIRN